MGAEKKNGNFFFTNVRCFTRFFPRQEVDAKIYVFFMSGWETTRDRVAELGSLSSGAKMVMKIFVKRVLTIFASNSSFLRVIANLQN